MVTRKIVSELCLLIVDCVNRTAPVVDYETPYKMIRTTNVRDGRIDISNARNVTKEIYEKWTRRAEVLDGDVVLTREAPIGEVGFIDNLGPVFLGQRIMQYRPDPEIINPRYFYYAFCSKDLQHQFGSHDGSGSVVSHIRVGDCHKFEMNVPNRSTQDAIADLLGTLDDKIELNRQMNDTLEDMARALFRDWFVDFGPTRRQMEGAVDPVAIMGSAFPPEKAAALAPLFPAVFGEDDLPEGWEYSGLSSIVEQQKQIVKPEQCLEEAFEHFSLPAFDKAIWPTLERGAEIKSNKTSVPNGSLLVSKLNPLIERVWVPQVASAHRQICSTEFLCLKPHNGYGVATIEALFRSEEMRRKMVSMVTGTSNSHQRVPPKTLMQVDTLLPAKVASFFEELAFPLLAKRQANQRENQTLAEMRDLLLPKLISGEISLKDEEDETE